MRSLIQQLINNQRYLSIAIFGSLISFLSLWYFLFYQNINREYSDSQRTKEKINNELKRYRSMHSQLPSMESEWEELNNEFQIVIDRIPDKRLFTNVTDYLYSMIINNGLKIINYSPSNIAIEKKKIYIPDLEDEILVEKIPIDITLKGSFLSFSKLLEDMQDSRYRLTSSDIGIKQKESSLTQSINFIAYAYFQTSKNKKISPKPQKIQKNEPTELPKKAKSVTSKSNIDADNIVDNKIVVPDDLENVPEMWLEPATEPIDDLEEQIDLKEEQKEITLSDPVPKQAKETKKIAKTEEPKTTSKDYNILSDLVVLQSNMCKKVKNNLPVDISKTFNKEDEKVICYSLVTNNTKKSKVVYHIWSMNGEVKAKVRIIVRPGKEILAISNRKVDDLDGGNWEIQITDVNKMILDTVIFEVV
tara:strand:+ start:285 stop:1538 length:1254 start_codon:yes stop_codon:yes gene_type:complete